MACLSRWLVLLVIAVVFAAGQHQCPEPQSALRLPGHATVYGLFDAHMGDNCSDPSVSGLQQMAAAAWMISTLNHIAYVPGVKLGLALYDGCSSAVVAQKTLLASIVDMGCDNSYVLGLVTSPHITSALQTLPKDLQIPVFSIAEPVSEKLLIRTAVNLLASLNWTTVGCVLAPSLEIINSFNQESVGNRLCALQEALLPSAEKGNWTDLLEGPLSSLSQDSVVVVIGTWHQIVSTVIASRGLNIYLQWVIIPLDIIKNVSNVDRIIATIAVELPMCLAVEPVHEIMALLEEEEPPDMLRANCVDVFMAPLRVRYGIDEDSVELPTDSLIVLPGIGLLQQEEETHISFEDNHKYDANVLNSQERLLISYPLFMQVAMPVLQIAHTFKTAFTMHCTSNTTNVSSIGICSNLPQFNTLTRVSGQNMLSKKNEIQKLLTSNTRIFLTAVTRVTAGTILEEVAVYSSGFDEESVELKLVSNINSSVPKDEFCRLGMVYNVTTGRDCQQCSNFAHYYISRHKETGFGEIFSAISWRSDAWVAAVASIGAVGIACCFVISIFIAVRILKGDILEGNPTFSFFLLISIVFTYCATLPFSFNVNDPSHFLDSLFCSLRVTGTSLGYALLFSIMFSRGLMLASCDQDGGFMSHINGYIQSVLCFFILGVQIALSTQFWIINTTFLDPNQCASMYEGYYFQILLCYDIFLLILLVCTCPFTIRSKRNYREGIYFTAASILSLLIWVGWTTAYLLSPREWQDAAISGGLAATASGILITVFIPRTYMMMTAIVRDNLTSALPTLACANSTSILDLNYRAASHQALYDCVNPVLPYSTGQINPNFYSEHPEANANFPFKTSGHQRPTSPENPYQRCDSPASPNKVTHF
ncbi:G-protein coupled receptor family C group 6 member A [Anabrus simplex]|uniref:G-protein coupled receptor family C group 6 member A n=1 Tax=Anabrus simplex TaxID=316456 RepID=UPI0035A3109F